MAHRRGKTVLYGASATAPAFNLCGKNLTKSENARLKTVKAAISGVALLALAGCAPPLQEGRLQFPFAASWQGKAGSSPRLLDNRSWWQGLEDRTLDDLIARALRSSPDLTAARARADAASMAAQAIPGPVGLSGGARATQQDQSGGPTTRTAVADLGLEWLLDPGRTREAQRLGANASAALAQAERDGAELFLIAQIAESYLNLRHAQSQLALAQAEGARLRQALELARRLDAAGEATVLDTTRAEARLASLQTRLPVLESAPKREILRLGVLVGDAPGALPQALARNLQHVSKLPVPRMRPDPTVPADLLRNRPDLRMAEARYDAARGALGEARAALYPRLTLTGTIEIRQQAIMGSNTQTSLASFGPALRLPAFPSGPARASVSAAEMRLIAAHADWQQAVLDALFEVEAALLDYAATTRAEQAARRAQSLHATARDLQSRATEAGEATVSDLLAVEADLGTAAAAQADAQLARARAFVTLNLRLGSGG